MRVFIDNVLLLGFWNIVLIAFVMLLVHQGLARVLAMIEKLNGMEVKNYWYDVPIAVAFIFAFVYSIYYYR